MYEVNIDALTVQNQGALVRTDAEMAQMPNRRQELKARLDSCLLTDEEMSMKPEDLRKWFEELENQEEITGKIPATGAAS
jgi:hypothetical protein